MNGRHVALLGAFGLAALAVGVGVLIALVSAPKPETAAPGAAGVVGLLVGAVALVATVLRARGDPGPDAEPAPWTESGRIVDRPPEETPDDVTVSGTGTAGVFARATDAARSAGDVEAGVREVRPLLRETLGGALAAGGREGSEVERALATGSWTDDRLAAAVLDDAVEEPRRTLRERLRDWLFPERALRERTRRAVAAVDEAASEELPTVVGEEAPRTVPVVAPTLADLQRTADGRLQRAEAVGESGRRGWNDPMRRSDGETDRVADRDADRTADRDTNEDGTNGSAVAGRDAPSGDRNEGGEGDADDRAGAATDGAPGEDDRTGDATDGEGGVADWGDVGGGDR